jgi:hypothetical protein
MGILPPPSRPATTGVTWRCCGIANGEMIMRTILLWFLGIPIPILILLLLFGVL